LDWTLKSDQPNLLRKNRTAEEMPNGKAGALNQYGRYFSGRGTLDEKPIPREDGRRAETAAFKRRNRRL
jgi:hypothetical protein